MSLTVNRVNNERVVPDLLGPLEHGHPVGLLVAAGRQQLFKVQPVIWRKEKTIGNQCDGPGSASFYRIRPHPTILLLIYKNLCSKSSAYFHGSIFTIQKNANHVHYVDEKEKHTDPRRD